MCFVVTASAGNNVSGSNEVTVALRFSAAIGMFSTKTLVASATLAPGGKLVTFSYIHGFFLPSAVDFRKRLSHYFSTVKMIGPVWRNFPPAMVYTAEA